jgi:hypothetical protein
MNATKTMTLALAAIGLSALPLQASLDGREAMATDAQASDAPSCFVDSSATGDLGPECATADFPRGATIILLGTGLAGVIGVARRRDHGADLEASEE